MGSTHSRLHHDRKLNLADRLGIKSRKRTLVISPPLYSASTIWSASNMLMTTTAVPCPPPSFWSNSKSNNIRKNNDDDNDDNTQSPYAELPCPGGSTSTSTSTGTTSSPSSADFPPSLACHQQHQQQQHYHGYHPDQSLALRLAGLRTGSTLSLPALSSSECARYDFDFVYDHAAAVTAAASCSCSSPPPASSIGLACTNDASSSSSSPYCQHHHREDSSKSGALELSGIISFGQMYLRLDQVSKDGNFSNGTTVDCPAEDGCVTTWI